MALRALPSPVGIKVLKGWLCLLSCPHWKMQPPGVIVRQRAALILLMGSQPPQLGEGNVQCAQVTWPLRLLQQHAWTKTDAGPCSGSLLTTSSDSDTHRAVTWVGERVV